jgi:hypothetical protein
LLERFAGRLNLPRDGLLIVGLFIAFRVMILASVWPVTLIGDYGYYFALARLSDQGSWPYLHYWMEYPPIFPFLSTAVYRLVGSGEYDAYALVIGTLLTLFSAGCLIVLMRLAWRLHGEAAATRLGWVYGALAVPVIITWWQFEPITAFCILVALDRFLAGRDVPSAIATGLGAMVKLVPLLVLPAVALARSIRKTMVYGAIALLVIAAVLAPLWIAAPETTRASMLSPLSWSSWETVWALIDDNYRSGSLGWVEIHFDNALATTPVGNPSRVPDALKAIVFGAAYLAILWRVRATAATSPVHTIGIVTITYVVFLLWSKGWSPQWQMILIPLVLLLMPDRTGIGFVLVFGLVNLAEWPVLISRNQWSLVVVTILLRTLLLLVLLFELMNRLRSMGRDVEEPAGAGYGRADRAAVP